MLRNYKMGNPNYEKMGTLNCQNVQFIGCLRFIQATGLKKEDFWSKSKEMTASQDASEILCYMNLMIKEANHNEISLTRDSFKKFGAKIQLFDGVEKWFEQINSYGKSHNVIIQHFINSSGLKEMIEGTPIARYFERIYACSFYYSPDNVAIWPAVAVDFTAKTQFLFMINKGIKYIKDNRQVNKFTPDKDRPIPFNRMIYFGDGETDIPCMKLIKQNSGHSIAVYPPLLKEKKDAALNLLIEDRVNFVCPADYKINSELYLVVKQIIDKIKTDFDFNQTIEKHKNKVKSHIQ